MGEHIRHMVLCPCGSVRQEINVYVKEISKKK